MILGVLVSGWVASGGLKRLWRRIRGVPVAPAPGAPVQAASAPRMPEAFVPGKGEASAPEAYAPVRQATSAPGMEGV